jgi:hypothetical protein
MQRTIRRVIVLAMLYLKMWRVTYQKLDSMPPICRHICATLRWRHKLLYFRGNCREEYTSNYHSSRHYLRTYIILEHDVSETSFCLRLQVEPTQWSPTPRASLSLRTAATRETEIISIYWAQLSRFRNVVFWITGWTMYNAHKCDSYITTP